MRIALIILFGIALCLSALAIYTLWQAKEIAEQYPASGLFVKVEDVDIHFTDSKPSGLPKATILLIHGASGNEAEMRLALAERLLAHGYRVISVDRPGQGWSTRSAVSANNNLTGQARLIRRAMNKHGVDRALIVVHSLAGTIGLRLAMDHPEFVSGLMMVSPVTHPWPGGIALYYSISASQLGPAFNYTLALPLGQVFTPPAVRSVFSPQSPASGHIEKIKLPLVLRPKAFAANARDVASLYHYVTEQFERYKTIRLPVAIIAGSADEIVITDIHSRNSAKEIPGATLRILPAVGHVPHWTHTADVVAEIERLYSRTRQ